MTDVFSPQKRSDVMSRIRSKNTRPEIRVRKFLHMSGIRFRIHVPNLPGKPDIVMPKYQTAIQVRGCFWHQHDCPDGKEPKSHRGYWIDKLRKNVERDSLNDSKLEALGWRLFVIWECDICSDKELTTTCSRVIDEIRGVDENQ